MEKKENSENLRETDLSVVTGNEVKELVSEICYSLKVNYVFPEVAEKICNLLLNNMKKGKYDSISNTNQCVEHLTKDLQSINNDLHLTLIFDPENVQERRKYKVESVNDKYTPEAMIKIKKINFGIKEAKILDGNIGYLNIRSFIHPKIAGDTASAAMTFLSNTDALIIDLRDNTGGSPEMVQFLTSYFFNPLSEPLLLNSIYWKPDDKNYNFYTLPYVPGSYMSDIDLYLLIGENTISAAELFCYGLRNLNRATLIGQKTYGAANPTNRFILSDRFLINITCGISISPITKTNWDGVGVEPHIEMAGDNVFNKVHEMALKKVAE